MKKVIFLDIDGVLNDEGDNLSAGVYIDKEMTVRLKKIVDATGADIVLTSSWRKTYSMFCKNPESVSGIDRAEVESLCTMFADSGLKISGCTDYLSIGPYARPYEIRSWLVDQEDLQSFVILDDDHFWCWNWLADRVVMTKRKNDKRNWERGLDDANVDQAIAILNDRS